MTPPWLTDAETDALCDGLVQNAAKVKYLRDLGLAVREKPNGRPLVLRTNVEEVLGGLPAKARRKQPAARPPAQPDADALRLVFSRKG